MNTSEWAAWIQAVGGLISAASTIIIALMLQNYAKRRDKASIIHEMWRQQQDWNLQAVSSPLHARAAELMVYGGSPANDDERHALRSCVFFFLNRVNHIYDGYCHGILSKEEFTSEAASTIGLIAGQKDLAIRILQYRGYDSQFCAEVTQLIRNTSITSQVDTPTSSPP